MRNKRRGIPIGGDEAMLRCCVAVYVVLCCCLWTGGQRIGESCSVSPAHYKGRIFKNTTINSTNSISTAAISSVHGCREMCARGTAGCIAVSFNTSKDAQRNCRLYSLTNIKSYMVPAQKSFVILLLPFHCGRDSAVNGSWSQWTDETACPDPCPKVDMMEVRTCTDPYPSCNGDFCTTGINRRFRQCKAGECKGLEQLRDPHPNGIIYFNISSRRVPLKPWLRSNGKLFIRFQRRLDGSVSFKRNWPDYKHGFVELTESFQWHSGQPFSTFDKDNDNSASVNCAHTYEGGWWFKGSDCLKCNLNGKWYGAAGGNQSKHGIVCQSLAADLDGTFIGSKMAIRY